MSKTAQEVFDEAMKSRPTEDIRIRVDAFESRDLTKEEKEKYGVGQVAAE